MARTSAEVEAVLNRAVRRLRPTLAALEDIQLEDDDAALLEGSQPMLLHVPRGAPRPGARLAVAAGFSLHADTAVHADDRQGLEHLRRYGARGALALSRLQRLEDGRLECWTKRGGVVVLTAAALLKRLLLLVPPRGLHLTRLHGVFAPNARLRGAVALPPPPTSGYPHPAQAAGPAKDPRRRLDWATVQKRTFGEDVFRCHCGGRRRVVAIVTSSRTAEEVLRNCTGFVVDSVHEVLRFGHDALEDAPRLSAEQARLMGKVANLTAQKRMIQILDVGALVGPGEIPAAA